MKKFSRVALHCFLYPEFLVSRVRLSLSLFMQTEYLSYMRLVFCFQQGQGSVLPVRKGFRVFTAWGTLTNESRLTKEEAEGPRKDSGVRRAGVSLLDWASASPSTSRSKASGSFVPFCFTLGVWSPNRSSSGIEMIGLVGRESEWSL